MKRIHVVAAVIYAASSMSQILIAKRPNHLHQGGLWEFPGGKVDQGESPRQALVRELQEELDINVTTAEPMMQLSHDYTDKQVLLDIWKVTGFEGQARGVEGQECRWVSLTEIVADNSEYQFPAANRAILARLKSS
ncbi:8-oxo-dGTP diphosphatase MutT [Porticoccaceae bacterium]|jgi:8-oxo-dGTP diphosphatase|nr:8-oxo-dGTP diphosphatase MutT [Porticoccaceae bacterium]